MELGTYSYALSDIQKIQKVDLNYKKFEINNEFLPKIK